jgi:hypothetical protein
MADAPNQADQDRLTILVSSAVYGIEELLELVYALLTRFGYEVWMSHKGTVPVYPDMTAFESCLLAVERCDLFLGILTTHYGSGKLPDDLSITHQELLKAIELGKPRWILAHDHLPFARTLLRSLGHDTNEKRAALPLKKNAVLDDLRVVEMYEAAIRHDLKVYQDRKGNWVQQFVSADDAQLFVTAQFHRYAQVERFLQEHFADQQAIRQRVRKEESK